MPRERLVDILEINIPDAPSIPRGSDMRTIGIAITDHINILTHAMQSMVRSQAELTGVVMGFNKKLDDAILTAVRRAQESVPDLMERTMDDKELKRRRARDEFVKKVGGKMVVAVATYVAAAAAGGLVWEIVHHIALK